MSHPVSDHPDPARLELLDSVFEPSPHATVAEAVSLATEHETQVYVERLAGGWRWSLAHRGDSYPLLRITARFLRVDHARIMIGFRTIAGGYAVLCDDPKVVQRPEASAIIDFEPHSSPATVERRILEVLGQRPLRKATADSGTMEASTR